MDTGFWKGLHKPIMAMAPMANVTDAAFRQLFARLGKPDVFWTEFVSVEGLLSAGREELLVDFWKSEAERPIVAQIFGSKPEQFEAVARMIQELGFDGIDINMGCPDSGIEKSGAGASLIKNPELARQIIQATKRGAGELPVSVKTRIGYANNEIDSWIGTLLAENIAALTVHLRTRNEMSDVPARWNLAKDIRVLRDRISPETILLGNGDVDTVSEGRERVKESGFDGVMIGRGMFGNPWLFSERVPSITEKLMTMIEHTELFEKLYRSKPAGEKQIKNFDIMKKHFKAYCSGFDGAKELRITLMATHTAHEVRTLTEDFLRVHSDILTV
jgi:nifR3 family TIM-barrel protein